MVEKYDRKAFVKSLVSQTLGHSSLHARELAAELEDSIPTTQPQENTVNKRGRIKRFLRIR